MNNTAVIKSVLIAGYGDVGSALAALLIKQGYSVYGLRRNINSITPPVKAISADLSNPQSMRALPSVDMVIYCAAPTRSKGDDYSQTYLNGFKNLLQALPTPPKHCIFTSSTSVYHQDSDQWIDESSPTLPTSERGKMMRLAEQQVEQLSVNSTIVRFSGIYGPGREHLLNQVRQGKFAADTPRLFSNRIHRDDCAGLLCHLVQAASQQTPLAPIYLASDSYPCPINEVTDWLGKQLNIPPAEPLPQRQTPSKRCNNSLILALGYQLKYPDFKAGYAPLLRE